MPKINLLQQAPTEAAVAKPVSTQLVQQIVMLVVALLGLAVAIFIDWSIVNRENETVKEDLAREQAIAKELEDMKKQGDELQKKIELVENRIKVIKQLRAEQRGPVAVLSSINERIPIGIKLDSITQRGSLMTVVGSTTTESLITTFAKDLEFSGGLFTNFDVQTQLRPGGQGQEQSWTFTIRCNYNPPVAAPPQSTTAATQTASN
ncbi:MAG: PilN domain-containing protein [Acidobacteriota bacterium]|nr:PilN domain-containing protein [Blastocatellia bacterium]MDW8413348.1 PilN domain-containing protein [Acidobacteriota bacterium]